VVLKWCPVLQKHLMRRYDKNVKELIGIAKRKGDENTDIENIHERERG